jgi:ribosomal protein L11 methyltransferase
LSWQRLRFQVYKDQAEAVGAVLEACLAQAITTENAGDNEFYEVAFPGEPDWEQVYVTGLFTQSVNLDEVCQLVEQVVPGDDALLGEVSVLKDQDWERVWLSQFKPVKVGKDLWVVPKWLDPVNPNACNIALDPGLAFGTGTHRTTAMCLDWLSHADLSGRSVIDYGCGSGILAIAALLLGAKTAVAVDIDPMAISASIENGSANGVSDQLQVLLPDQVDDSQVADVVIVNILAEEIIKLAPALLKMLKPGFTLLLTGILDDQRGRVVKAFPECQFQKVERGQWCLLIGSTFD